MVKECNSHALAYSLASSLTVAFWSFCLFIGLAERQKKPKRKEIQKSIPTLFMENTDSQAKQAAFDNKSAYAGDLSAETNDEVSIDQLGTAAGLDIQPESPLSVAEDLKARDENRMELVPNEDNFEPDLPSV
ncbi:MAG: DUF6335 family protein [Cyanobacteria bacterium J06581_3]